MNNSNCGLVLEGGGLRGLFTAGVLDQMMQWGLTFPHIVGVSAGCCFGVNIKSHQIGRALRYNVLMHDEPRYMSLRSWIKTGEYIGAHFCYHVVPTQIDIFDMDTFNADPQRFDCVCTDVLTGNPVYHELKHMSDHELEWVRASASLPLVSKPVQVDGQILLDGGLSDSIPLKYMETQGYQRNIIVLTQPLGYRKKPASMMPMWRFIMRKYPKIIECLEKRHLMYNSQLDYVEEQARQGKVLLIAPPEKLPIGRIEMNPDKMKLVHQIGVETAKQMEQSIREFLI